MVTFIVADLHTYVKLPRIIVLKWSLTTAVSLVVTSTTKGEIPCLTPYFEDNPVSHDSSNSWSACMRK